MTTMELNAELLRELSTIASDETLLRKAIKAIKALKKEKTATDVPCSYTIKEVKSRLKHTREDALNAKGISEKEAEQMMEEML